ncbi:uridine transporter UriT [Streptantibioticus cattleyicolor]|uniref:Major facilitator transporter n=1 Tax=Streptantibioticus cattleyicolor (strain ATCC 35852 / DSM 46488 / JCM 4925 / NBRC 14057 / NRRL 8057) TaxID=1003195 RepID=F8JKT4_STREN|nr:MFS transporter [Streptantibioticus cattleyicolor]AEW98414.1 major facilitator transporter [Streptantibioticus cattleyicolor NRRL 8057 = DSM 46488]CCB72527.1 Major facilitator superfamily MFS_1 [Streptantibioticus cattleyicolor NRRL 8057 = DSM 46488]
MTTDSATRPVRTAAGTAALMTALLAACVAFQLNASMLSPALVTMARELHTDDAGAGLSQTAFFTASAMFSLFLPRFSDIAGRKRVLRWMLLVMAAGTVLAAVAPDITVLDIARVVQGASGPVVQISLLMLRSEVTDPKRFGTLMGVVAAVNGGIAGVDALAGGWLAGAYGFRSVFWVIAVVAVVAVALVTVGCRESRPSAGTPMDWPGVVPVVLCVAALLLAVDEAEKLGAANWPLAAALLIVAAVAFALFWRAEKRSRHPLVRIEDLKRRASWAPLLTTTLTLTGVFATVNGVLMSFVQNRQAGFGMDSSLASLAFLTPFALVGWVVGPFTGRLAPVLGYRRVLRWGLGASAVIIVVMAVAGVHSLPVMIVCTVLLGVSYAGVANIVLNLLGVVLAPKDHPGFLPGLVSAAFGLGAGLSFALLTAVQVSTGYVTAMLAGAVVTLAAFGASYFLPRPQDAEVTS